ncbi:YncE family protein [Nonomuraea roseoviolacea]|uniref:YVTN family beta-propeller protein n=3 Tax=Nonomuraea TaxID=83681 RepID=A0ABT1JY44_9ACTN|nr:YncE family protein [Nonomuraea roseoviolacea]MCP2346640.1 YVTN family beta-propeller protein [Nonomuraea roseoviolacea subsp. carminata]
MRLRWMTSMLGAAAVAAASCAAPPTPMAAAPQPVSSPRRQHPQVSERESPTDVYAHDRPGMLDPKVRNVTPRVYVPNSESGTVDVINPRTFQVVRHFRVGSLPQHVVPSWDLRTLWVNENKGNNLTPIDPVTGRPGRPVPVDDPYNLYFTPDGSYALVMAERNNRLDFRDPRTMRLVRSLPLPCRGVNHGDFTADGSVFLASCEFSGQLVAIDWKRPRVRKVISVGAGNMPQDVKLSPDGRVFYVADMMAGGTWIIDAAAFRRLGFLRTGKGAHGLYVSRDSRSLYVSNRDEGTVSVVSFAGRKVVDRWRIPGGGSPDMGGVSADGKQLWLSGRYHGVVYVFSTGTGKLLHTIKVGRGPHGLCFFPQPGRYSLGHTGVFR